MTNGQPNHKTEIVTTWLVRIVFNRDVGWLCHVSCAYADRLIMAVGINKAGDTQNTKLDNQKHQPWKACYNTLTQGVGMKTKKPLAAIVYYLVMIIISAYCFSHDMDGVFILQDEFVHLQVSACPAGVGQLYQLEGS